MAERTAGKDKTAIAEQEPSLEGDKHRGKIDTMCKVPAQVASEIGKASTVERGTSDRMREPVASKAAASTAFAGTTSSSSSASAA